MASTKKLASQKSSKPARAGKAFAAARKTGARKSHGKKSAAPRINAGGRRRLSGLVPSSVYHKASLLVLSPYRFPVDADKLAIQSARLVGLAFVFIGAVLTVFHVPGMEEKLMAGKDVIQNASVVEALKGTEYVVIHGSPSETLPQYLQTKKISVTESLLSGYGKPNTPTLVYFFTAPSVASVVTDETGNWSYDPKNISLKSERVAYVAVTENARMPEPSSIETELQAAAVTAKLDAGVLNLLMSIGVVILGLLLLLLGLHLKSEREKGNKTEASLPTMA